MIWQFIDSGGFGGVERHVATLTRCLTRHGLDAEVVLYADHGPSPWRDQLASAGVDVREVGGAFSGLFDAMTRRRPHLVHTHGYKAGVLGRIACALKGTPVVSTFHAGERAAFPVCAYQSLDAWTSCLATRIAVSDEIRRRLPFASTVVPSFVDLPETPGPGESPRTVAFVGRISFEKGPDRFCALARRAGAGLDWTLYGDGPMRAALEAVYGGDVRFHGVATDMDAVWPGVGLLVMPSRAEGLPLAALEAMAAGVPVLASRVGGLAHVVDHGETGWLVDDGDEDAAIACVELWLRLPAERRAAMRRACRGRIAQTYSEAVVLPRILAIYRRAGLASARDAAPSLAGA